MIPRLSEKMIGLFYPAFTLCFVWLINHIVTGNWYGCEEVPLLLCILCALGLLLILRRLIRKHGAVLERHSAVITAVFLTGMFAVQMTSGILLRYKPIFDVDAIYGGAIEWVETGSFPSYYEYFSYFFNNFGGLRLYYWVFRFSLVLGCRDWYMAAVTANALLSLCTMYVTGSVCRRLMGPGGRFMAYTLFLISPPFWFIAPAFYTDALCMPFPILAYRLYLMIKDSRRGRAWRFIALGMVSAAGILIKPVVSVALAAIVIDAALTWDRRRALAIAAAVLLCLVAGKLRLDGAVYQHLDRAEAERNRTPILHWVMMGLQGDGMYNAGDYEFTRSFDDRAEQSAALRAEIGERIRARGFNGMVDLLTRKGDICFGDGTYGLQDCLGGDRERDSFLHVFLLSDGRYHAQYRTVCTGILMAVYVLVIVSGAQEVLCPDSAARHALAPRLAVFGILLFLICWEARWRYFSSFVPMIFVSALLGMERFSLWSQAVFDRVKEVFSRG